VTRHDHETVMPSTPHRSYLGLLLLAASAGLGTLACGNKELQASGASPDRSLSTPFAGASPTESGPGTPGAPGPGGTEMSSGPGAAFGAGGSSGQPSLGAGGMGGNAAAFD